MSFSEVKKDVDKVKDEVKALIDSNVSYFKLWGFKVGMKSFMLVLKFAFVLLFVLLFVLFGSIALGIMLSEYLNSYVLGFSIIAGIYLILAILINIFKTKLIKRLILRKFSEIFFNE